MKKILEKVAGKQLNEISHWEATFRLVPWPVVIQHHSYTLSRNNSTFHCFEWLGFRLEIVEES